MPKQYTFIVEKGKDGYLVSRVLGLPDCFAKAKSMDKLLERTKEAILLFLKTSKDKEVYSKFVGFQQIEV